MDLSKIGANVLFKELARRVGTSDVGKMGGMSLAQFTLTAASAVIPCVELMVISQDGKNVLLTHRDDDDFKGWHFPGTAIMKGERTPNCLMRLAKSEIGVQIQNPQLVGACNYLNQQRMYAGQRYPSHWIGMIFIATICHEEEPKRGEWFKVSMPPENLISEHENVWRDILVPTLEILPEKRLHVPFITV